MLCLNTVLIDDGIITVTVACDSGDNWQTRNLAAEFALNLVFLTYAKSSFFHLCLSSLMSLLNGASFALFPATACLNVRLCSVLCMVGSKI